MEFISNGKSAEIIANQLNKITVNSTSNPTATDDSSKNFFVGSKWLNTATQQEYTCIRDTVGAAVWKMAAPDMASESEATAGTDNTKAMSSLRVSQQITSKMATDSEATTRTDNTKLMTPLRVDQEITSRVATDSEATTGTNDTKISTPLKVFKAIAQWISNVQIGSTGSFTNASIASTDTVKSSLGKLQGQINAQQKKITSGTAAPSGGSNGDIYIQYF